MLGEPGAETTPFPDPFAEIGWEDEPDHPRSAAELVTALESSDAIIERCLDSWTTDMLETEFERRYRDVRQVHTRRSILLRMLSHDAFHSGEISQLLGSHGLPAMTSGDAPADHDRQPWSPASRFSVSASRLQPQPDEGPRWLRAWRSSR